MKATLPFLGATAALLFALTPTGVYAGDDEGVEESHELSHKAQEKWTFVLPTDKWNKIEGRIELPDIEFEAEAGGPLKLRIDANGDGRIDTDVKGQKGFVTLKGKNTHDELVKYSIRLKNVGTGKYEWAPGSSMSGKVHGETIHLIDANGNGTFADFGEDAIAIGNERGASYLSKVISIKGDLYHFDVDEAGDLCSTRPFEGETGMLEVTSEFEAKGKLISAVFTDGDVSFNAAGHKKGLTVPAGDYKFQAGYAERGSASVRIRKGEMLPVKVAADTDTKLDWGSEIHGGFTWNQTADKVKVNADMKFFGRAGEEYYDFMPRGKGPKILILEKGGGKEVRSGRFGST